MKKNDYVMTKLGFKMYTLIGKLGVYVGSHPVLYYILNLTWGLPLTLLGYILTLIMLPGTLEIKKYNYIYGVQLMVGRFDECSWGFEMGTCFFTSLGGYKYTDLKAHEFGHTCQNAILGPFQLFLVTIPSIIRFWWRRYLTKKGKTLKTNYDEIWFERSASDIGQTIRDNRLHSGKFVEE